MTSILLEQLAFFFALFAIIDPIAAVPIFISLTYGETKKEVKRECLAAGLTMFIALVCALYFGDKILSIIGADLNSFKVAGGIILFIVALKMLQLEIISFSTTQEERDHAARRDVFVGAVPMGIPLLAGPGAMTLTIIAGHDNSFFGKTPYIFSIFVLAFLSYLCLRMAPYVSKKLGPSGMNIFTRVAGLLVSAVAVKLMTEGLLALLPGLGR